MTDPIRPALYTVPFGQDLCDATVSVIFEKLGRDPLTLSNAVIFLPNNRAITAMTEAFVRALKPGLLLPHMAALGDLALDDKLGALFDPLGMAPAIPPAIAPMARLLLLARLVTQQRAATGAPVTPTEALRFARKLCDVIDELEVEQVQFGRFDVIKPEGQDLAAHWQKSFVQLLQLLPDYHAELAALGLTGPSQRRNLLLDRLGKSLAGQAGKPWVIAAGISTAAPAISRLLRRIALLPQSMVIFPAIDVDMSDADWDSLGPHEPDEGQLLARSGHESHPQYHLKLLLDRMGFGRSELTRLGQGRGQKRKGSSQNHSQNHSESHSESQTIPQIFCLPQATAGWIALPAAQKKMKNVRLMVAEESAQEAAAIAILIRGALEQSEKRIALVTPDRELARRCAAQLKRWNIHVDDSAGVPLLHKPEATLIMALAEILAQDFAPVPLLSLIKHPLVHKGDGRTAWLEQARNLDLLLRGPNEGVGLDAIGARIGQEQKKTKEDRRILAANDCAALAEYWLALRPTLDQLKKGASGGLSAAIIALQDAATTLSQGAVWKGAGGRQLAGFFDELGLYDLSKIGPDKNDSIPPILSELMRDLVVRPAYGGHPRVAIYGLLEARLQQADMVICAGLNEGSWPRLAQPDPWLAPRIRRDLKLPAPERNIGLAAHDLASMLGAQEVILTRSKRDRSGPTVASRFLLRMQALLGSALKTESMALTLADWIDRPDAPAPKYRRPAPKPSAEQRKLPVSITQFDTLRANPYSFYASQIMNLKLLEAVDAEPSHAWRGTIIHRILELWHKEENSGPEALISRAQDLLSNNALHPTLRAMWQPRIAKALRWIAEETQRMRDEEGRTVLVAEQKGVIEMAGVTVTGRADRIDQIAGGGLAIVDYKTGKPPSAAQIAAGFALQLGLIGYMAENGAIEGAAGIAARFEYWSLAKDKGDFGAIKIPTSDKPKPNAILSRDLVAFAEKEATGILNYWISGDAPFTAMLEPQYAYSEYNQLMRLQEWDGREALAAPGDPAL